jgi:hypothetical protein
VLEAFEANFGEGGLAERDGVPEHLAEQIGMAHEILSDFEFVAVLNAVGFLHLLGEALEDHHAVAELHWQCFHELHEIWEEGGPVFEVESCRDESCRAG